MKTSTTKTTTARTAFDSSLPIDTVLLKIDDFRQVTDEQLENLRTLFNCYGFVVIEHAPTDKPEVQLLEVGKLLGTPNVHDRANEQGIVSMAPQEGLEGYLGTSNAEHPLHTDGAYDEVPPRLLCLQCEQHAVTGGDSVLVSAKGLYEWLKANHPESIEALQEPDVLTVERVNRKGTKAILQKTDDLMEIVWRDDFTTTFANRPNITAAIEHIRSYIHDPANQVTFKLMPNQIILADNMGVLHGRTAFEKGDKRKLNRTNNNGDSEFSKKLIFGFGQL